MRGLRPLPLAASSLATVLALASVALFEQGRVPAGLAAALAAAGLAVAVGRDLARRARERRARAAERERAFAAGLRPRR